MGRARSVACGLESGLAVGRGRMAGGGMQRVSECVSL